MGDNLPTIFMNSKNSRLIKLLEMIPGDNIEFENNIPIKHNAKNPNFSPDEKAEIQVILNEMLNKTIIRETINRICLTNFYSQKGRWRVTIIPNLSTTLNSDMSTLRWIVL